MNLVERLDNVYVIDTKMFGFDNYCAAYLVEGEKIALIDTGMASQTEALRAGIKSHGFSISDISHVFITHTHHDHIGNVAMILNESPKASVYIHPVGVDYLTDPSKELAELKQHIPLAMLERFGVMEPVPPSRIKCLNDGDVFDLGNGEKLKIIFTPGHQPSGVVMFEEKNRGLFVDDIVGNCFPDADSHYPLNPPGADNMQAIESLKKLLDLPVNFLCMGHYGISNQPKQVITQVINYMQQLIDIGIKCIGENKPEDIGSKMWEMMMPELEKLRAVRGETVYQYAIHEHIPSQVEFFTKYCQERFKK
jgi:glyoxylase-like metal-dependent hydrolase (beta-lactamase superfamily II)